MINLSHSPLLQEIFAHADSAPQKVAMISGDVEVTYSALRHNILAAAYSLKEMGLHQGEIILLSARKELEFVYVYFASHLLGMCNVIVDPASGEERKSFIISRTKPKMLFGIDGNGINGTAYKEINLSSELAHNEIDECRDDIAEIMFTTGTTGKPKGVLLTHNNIYSSASNINAYIGNCSDDVEALGLPLCHSFGLGRLRCSLLKGATMVLLGNFANLKAVFQCIEEKKVTMFGMVPAVWSYIRKLSGTRIGKYAQQIRFIEIGSAPMSINDKQELALLFPHTRICMHYGLTEASRAAFMEFHQYKNRLSSIGQAVTDKVDIKIIMADGTDADRGQEGELCVRGNMVMKGYLDPEDRRNSFFGNYFRTGDLGYQDQNGDLYLTGRLKEIINIGGKKVSPQEVEDAIEALGVAECICVGVDDDKGVLGQVVKAYMVKGSHDIGIDEIRASLYDKLEHYKIPTYYEWVTSIPKTASGKKQRILLKDK